MGIIQKQTITGTIYSYLGVMLGFVNTGFLFPLLMRPDQIGVVNILVSYSAIFAQFASLGINNVTTRMFTYFRDEQKKHNGFLFIAVIVSLIGFLLSIIIFFLIKELLIQSGSKESPLFSDFYMYVLPLTLVTLYFNTFDNYYKVLYNAIIGTFLKEFLQRAFILLSIVLFYFGHISFSAFVLIYVIAFSLPTLIIMARLISEKQFSLKPQLDFVTKDMRNTMYSVGLFGIITGFSNLVILYVGTIMIAGMVGLSATGIYSTVFFYATLILIPSRALLKISSTLLADAWKENNMKNIRDIYYKSCLNQFVIAAFLFLGLWVNVDNIFRILPPEYAEGRYVLLFIGLANMFDMATGVNGIVISTSKYYRFHTYVMFILVGLVILGNYIFIPGFGLTGAAISSALATFVFNVIRYIFLYYKFRLQPFNYRFLIIMLIIVVSYLPAYFIPQFDNIYLDILIRGSVVGLIYIPLNILLKTSDEITAKFYDVLRWLKII